MTTITVTPETLSRTLLQAHPGSTIKLTPGTYAPFTVDVPGLTITGDGVRSVVDGKGSARVGVQINAGQVTLRDLTVRKVRGSGVRAAAPDVALYTLLVEDTGTGPGIDLFTTTGARVEFCTVRRAGYAGIYARSHQANPRTGEHLIRFCTVADCSMPGVLIEGFNADSRIRSCIVGGCSISGCGDGVYLRYADRCEVSGVTAVDCANTASHGEGCSFALQSSSDNLLIRCIGRNARRYNFEIWGGVPRNGKVYGPSERNLINSCQASGSHVGLMISSAYSADLQVRDSTFAARPPARDSRSDAVRASRAGGPALFEGCIFEGDLRQYVPETGPSAQTSFVLRKCTQRRGARLGGIWEEGL